MAQEAQYLDWKRSFRNQADQYPRKNAAAGYVVTTMESASSLYFTSYHETVYRYASLKSDWFSPR